MRLLREYILISSQNSILSDRRYITEVLCVEIPLHESYPFSHEVQSRILYEHMLLEGFWSDVKEMAGTTKQLFSTFKEVTTDPERLSSFSSIIGKTAKYPIKQMYKLLDTIIDTLAKHEDKFPTFVSWAKKLKDFIKKLVGKVYGVDGWKGALVKTSFALAIKYLWDNVGEMVTAVNDGFKSLLTKLKDDLTGDKLDELMDKVKDFLKEKLSPVIDWVKEKFMSLAGKLVTQFSGIGAWFDWAKTAFKGAKFVLGFLTNPLKKFDGIKGFKAEGVLREYIRKLLNEGVEFIELDSPLVYDRAGNIKRLALCDRSVVEPVQGSDFGFNDDQAWDHFGASGRRLKKPRKGRLSPGVSDVCIIGFLDYHSRGTTSDGKEMWYIDYMKTRSDKGGQKIASQLIDQFYSTIAQPGDHVHFGKMMRKEIGHLKDKMVKQHPDINTIGAKNF
jgi:hypothetical protein